MQTFSFTKVFFRRFVFYSVLMTFSKSSSCIFNSQSQSKNRSHLACCLSPNQVCLVSFLMWLVSVLPKLSERDVNTHFFWILWEVTFASFLSTSSIFTIITFSNWIFTSFPFSGRSSWSWPGSSFSSSVCTSFGSLCVYTGPLPLIIWSLEQCSDPSVS